MDNILNSTVEMSQAELIFQLAKTNVEQEKRLKSTEIRLSVLEGDKEIVFKVYRQLWMFHYVCIRTEA